MKNFGFIGGLIFTLLLVPTVCAQKKVQADPNKTAVIIVGAGGEPRIFALLYRIVLISIRRT